MLIYPEIIDANIKATLQLLGNDPNRWRPHVKTSKLVFAMKKLVEQGVVNFKCVATLELQTAADAGARRTLCNLSNHRKRTRTTNDSATPLAFRAGSAAQLV